MKNTPLWASVILVLYLIGVSATCDDRLDVGPAPSEFTKPMREKLGARIAEELDRTEALLPKAGNFEMVYWAVQKLYDQATLFYRADLSSVPNNRWEKDRPWEVHLIWEDSTVNAFVVPGGDIYLTTGLLRQLRSEHELYYILTFEASLMNERHLLNRLVTEFDARSLAQLIAGQDDQTDLQISDLAERIPDLDYTATVLVPTDAVTLNEICETSAFTRDGVLAIKQRASADWMWIRNKDYETRSQVIRTATIDRPERCGSVEGGTVYEQYILNKLP